MARSYWLQWLHCPWDKRTHDVVQHQCQSVCNQGHTHSGNNNYDKLSNLWQLSNLVYHLYGCYVICNLNQLLPWKHHNNKYTKCIAYHFTIFSLFLANTTLKELSKNKIIYMWNCKYAWCGFNLWNHVTHYRVLISSWSSINMVSLTWSPVLSHWTHTRIYTHTRTDRLTHMWQCKVVLSFNLYHSWPIFIYLHHGNTTVWFQIS